MRKLLLSPVVALVALFGFNVAIASAHTVSITETSVCTDATHAKWQATFVLSSGRTRFNGTSTVTFSDGKNPMTMMLPGNNGTATFSRSGALGKSLTAMTSTIWHNPDFGPLKVNSTAVRPPNCNTPPPPPPPPLVKRPSAHIAGPCEDPMYRAVFNNRKSDLPVTFVFKYTLFVDDQVHRIRVKVGAGKRYVSKYVHVKGGSAFSIRTAGGKLLDSGLSAPGGWYGVCPA